MGTIFISCGQNTERERLLADGVADLVRSLTPHTPYVAVRQQATEALTRNILRNLSNCAGIIFILNRRDALGADHRTSVWTEQEIAIATFRRDVLDEDLPILAFEEVGIRLEGIRKAIILNATPFVDDAEVLRQVKETLPKWTDLDTQLVGCKLVLGTQGGQDNGKQFNYKLDAVVINDRTTPIARVDVVVRFPPELADSTPTDGRGVWRTAVFDTPPKTRRQVLGLRFHVRHEEPYRTQALAKEVVGLLFVDGRQIMWPLKTGADVVATRTSQRG